MDQAAQLISSLGFPIVVTGVLAIYINKLGDQHHEEMNAVVHALEANTNALIKLDTKVDVLADKMVGNGSDLEEDYEIHSED